MMVCAPNVAVTCCRFRYIRDLSSAPPCSSRVGGEDALGRVFESAQWSFVVCIKSLRAVGSIGAAQRDVSASPPLETVDNNDRGSPTANSKPHARLEVGILTTVSVRVEDDTRTPTQLSQHRRMRKFVPTVVDVTWELTWDD